MQMAGKLYAGKEKNCLGGKEEAAPSPHLPFPGPHVPVLAIARVAIQCRGEREELGPAEGSPCGAAGPGRWALATPGTGQGLALSTESLI